MGDHESVLSHRNVKKKFQTFYKEGATMICQHSMQSGTKKHDLEKQSNAITRMESSLQHCNTGWEEFFQDSICCIMRLISSTGQGYWAGRKGAVAQGNFVNNPIRHS